MSVGLIKARLSGLLGLLSAVCFSAGQNIIFQFSCLSDEPVRELMKNATLKSAGISILILIAVNLLIRLAVGKWGTTFLITSVLTTVWGIANYFTILYHGAPLFVSELKSAGTAMEVIGTYKFGFDEPVRKIVIMGGMLIAASVILMILNRQTRRYTAGKFMRTLAGFAVCIFTLYLLMFSPYKIKPTDAIGWKWLTGIRKFGFPACAVEDVEKNINSLKKPEKYSTEAVMSYSADCVGGKTEKYPDIMLAYTSVIGIGDVQNLDACDILSIQETYATFDTVEALHRQGKRVFVWTVNEQETMERLIGLNVDAILTNDPQLALDTIKKHQGFADFYYRLSQILLYLQ